MENRPGKKIVHKILIMAVCVIADLLGKYAAVRLHLPIWLDAAGICVAAYFVGTAGGIAVGVLGSLLFGFVDPCSIPYALTGAAVAAAVGFCIRKGHFEDWSKAAVSSFWVGMLSVAVSTPINLIARGGYSGNVWGDALFDMLEWNGFPKAFSVIADEMIVEIVDKQICILIAFIFIRIIMRRGKRAARRTERIAAQLLSALLLSSCLLGAVSVSADGNNGGAGEISENFTAEIYNSSTGTMSSEANVIAETEDGYIWIGSYAGLTRYDGKEFEFISEGGIAGVTCMLTDSRGRLWIGTNDSGIARYENGEFVFFTEEDGLPVNSIRSFAEKEDGVIYVGTTDRICAVDVSDKVKIVPHDITYVISMESCGGMLVGVGNNGTLFALDEDGGLLDFDIGDRKLFCNCVEFTSRGLLLGTDGKEVYILERDGDKIKIAGEMTAEVGDVISMEEDKEGSVWLCAEAGMGFFDQNGVFHQEYYENFDTSFEWIHADYQGNIWVASSRYGVLKLSKSRFLDMFAKAGVPGLVGNAVVLYDGDYYCGTDNGLIILDGKSGESKENSLTKRLEGVRIRCLMVDSENRLWICSYSENGLMCYDGSDDVEIYNIDLKQMTSDRARCVIELRDKTIVAGTADGINFIRDGKVTGTITAKDGLANTQILSLLEGEDGVLYAGSDGGGMYEISNQKITRSYTTKDGLSSNVVLRIVPHDGGYIIITSNSLCYMKDGIKVLRNFPYFNNFDVCVDGGAAYVISSAGIYIVDAEALCAGEELDWSRFGANEGLVSGLTANAWNFFDDERGVLYFCCNNGVTGFYCRQDNIEVDYRYGVTSVVCDGVEIPCDGGEYLLPANAKKVTVTASVRNYALSDVKVHFYIEGEDDALRVCSYRELEPMQLSNLPAGSYRICFQLVDNNGILQEKSYTLVKKMQVWEHTWFKIYLAAVCVEIIVFATWTVIIMINNSKKKEALEKLRRELEVKVSEQTEEIRAQQIQTVTALSEAVDAKDRYTSGHSKRVAEYARMIAARMGKSLEEQEEIYRAGLLHDVGKIRIPEIVINKPGKLTPEEYELVKVHPVTGYHILKGISGGSLIAQVARFHHERYDGTGYPNGLCGGDIPEAARIVCVADAYDTMASNRSYRKVLPQDVVRSEIEKGRGCQFDPEVADVMLQMIDEDKDYKMQQQTSEDRKTILVAGDERTNIETAEFIMEEEPNHKVIGASETEKVLELISNGGIDLLLLDDSLPDMDSLEEVLSIIKAASVPVVYMTSEKDLETIRKLTQLGVDDYLTKPFLPMTLKELVHGILNS